MEFSSGGDDVFSPNQDQDKLVYFNPPQMEKQEHNWGGTVPLHPVVYLRKRHVWWNIALLFCKSQLVYTSFGIAGLHIWWVLREREACTSEPYIRLGSLEFKTTDTDGLIECTYPQDLGNKQTCQTLN